MFDFFSHIDHSIANQVGPGHFLLTSSELIYSTCDVMSSVQHRSCIHSCTVDIL